jgi:hypothetical protein
MDVLALILTCSVYPDDHLIRAMVSLASQENPHFVGDMVTLVTFDRTHTLSDAQRIVGELEKRGGKPVVGLLGVPLHWAARHDKQPADLFDACTNLMVGSSVLQGHYEACSSTHSASTADPTSRRSRVAPPEAIRLCALRRYGQDLGIDGYAESALKYFSKQRVLFSGADGAPVAAEDCRCTEAARPARPLAARRPTRARSERVRRISIGLGGAPILE